MAEKLTAPTAARCSMKAFDELTLLALPGDIAVVMRYRAPRCPACTIVMLSKFERWQQEQFDEHGFEALERSSPLNCWDCERSIRGLNDLNPV